MQTVMKKGGGPLEQQLASINAKFLVRSLKCFTLDVNESCSYYASLSYHGQFVQCLQGEITNRAIKVIQFPKLKEKKKIYMHTYTSSCISAGFSFFLFSLHKVKVTGWSRLPDLRKENDL